MREEAHNSVELEDRSEKSEESEKISEVSNEFRSNALDEGVDHLLLPRLVEIDGELVAVDMRHAAIAEFLVEHAHADLEPHTFRGARRDQRAVDGDRLAAGGLRCATAWPVALRPLPARRFIETACEKILRGVEAARPIAAQGLVLSDLDMLDRQFVDKTRRQCGLPRSARAPVLRKGDLGAGPRARESDIR